MKPSLVSHSIKDHTIISNPPQQVPNHLLPYNIRDQSVENQTLAPAEAPIKVSLNLKEAPVRTMNMEILLGGSQ
jgi:hypothetical protein